MKDFIKRRDNQATRKRVLQNLEYLKYAVDSTNYNNYRNLNEDIELLKVIKSDDFLVALNNSMLDRKTLLDFLPSYTRSVIGMPSTTIQKNAQDLKYLDAIEKKDVEDRIDKRKELHIKWLIDGIIKLEDKEKRIIIDKYVFKLTDSIIMIRHDFAKRTFQRLLNQAYMDLAIIWNIEIYKKN